MCFWNKAICRPISANRNREVFGLDFSSVLGVDSILDRQKHIDYLLGRFAFGFYEIGPLDEDGVRTAIKHHLRHKATNCKIAACINKDYFTAFTLAYDFFDYFVIELGAEINTEAVDSIIDMRLYEQIYKPIILKLPQNLNLESLRHIVEYCMYSSIDGVEICAIEQIAPIRGFSYGKLPIIASCDFETPEQAKEIYQTGCSLIGVQRCYDSKGFKFVKQIFKQLEGKSSKYNSQ